MKMRIIDLMDDYSGNGIKLDPPERIRNKTVCAPHGPAPKASSGRAVHKAWTTHRGWKPLVIAASLMLVLTGAAVLRLSLVREPGSGNTLKEGPASAESSWAGGPSEAPVAVSESPGQEESADDVQTVEPIAPQVIEGVMDGEENECYGNLLYVGGCYYTMTENGPEPVEMQNITTTLELYGSWELSIDYAVIDGTLVLRNAASTEPYAELNGETVYWGDFGEVTLEEQLALDNQLHWTTPNVAIPTPVKGSTDTVMLTILRTDQSEVENCRYPIFYNLSTGEISDPLSSVPELFDHGNVSSVRFNDSLTRAIVEVFGVEQDETGSAYVGDALTYVCDLDTGEMTLVWELLEPYLPTAETDGTEISAGGGCRWADDDTLLFWVLESVPTETEAEPVEESAAPADPWNRHPWLFSYNVRTGTLNYKMRDVDTSATYSGSNEPYIHDFMGDDSGAFRVVDTASGTAYTLHGVTFQNISGLYWDDTSTRTVLCGDDGGLYLVDDVQMAWTDLSEYLTLPEENLTALRLVTDDWLCLSTEDQVYCYRIPADISMTPLTQK